MTEYLADSIAVNVPKIRLTDRMTVSVLFVPCPCRNSNCVGSPKTCASLSAQQSSCLCHNGRT